MLDVQSVVTPYLLVCLGIIPCITRSCLVVVGIIWGLTTRAAHAIRAETTMYTSGRSAASNEEK